jgi:hypothetical protein
MSHLLIRLGFVLCPLLRTHLLLLTLTPACSCVYICKFQFRPIHPPSRRLSVLQAAAGECPSGPESCETSRASAQTSTAGWLPDMPTHLPSEPAAGSKTIEWLLELDL